MTISNSSSSSSLSQKDVFIGIGFGSQYSSVCIIKEDGKCETVANEDGDRMIPSYVSFIGEDILIGTQAKLQSISNFRNTISQFRNLLGKTYSEDLVSEWRQHLPGVSIIPDPENESKPVFAITDWEGNQTTHSAKKITTMFLEKLKLIASAYLPNVVITGAVIAVPVGFDEQQRKELIDAAMDAGFGKIVLLDEPVAGALAYEERNQTATTEDKSILILDVGSYQFNISLLTHQNRLYTLRASQDDHACGGVHFDKSLHSYLSQEFYRKTRLDITDNKRSKLKLMRAAEVTKKSLSQRESAPCSVESLCEGVDFAITVHRGRFEMTCEGLLNRLLESLKSFMSEKIDKELNGLIPDISEVLFMGGASRIPRFQAMVKSYFETRKENVDFKADIEPDEVITLGCALHGYALMGMQDAGETVDEEVVKALCKDVAHLTKSVGIELGEDVLEVVGKGTPLPARKVVVFNADGNEKVFLRFVEVGADKSKKSVVVEIVAEVSKGSKGVKVETEMDGKSGMRVVVKDLVSGGGEKVVGKVVV